MTMFGTMPDAMPRFDDALKALGTVFRLPGFREGQEDIVRGVLEGHDTLAVMPTGSGKSLCYQLPGFVMPGITLVISPLIALMKDQVDSLLAKGIRAVNLHSGLQYAEQQAVLDDVLAQRVKFLFVAPERMRNSAFQGLLQQIQIGLLAVDEAHCISQWGHDFRPDYRRIGALRQVLGCPVTIALTATASPAVQHDIVEQLQLNRPKTHILGFDRVNLRFGVKVIRRDAEKMDYALEFVRARIQQRCGFKRSVPGCGIIYAPTIQMAESVGNFLNDHGIRAGVYHARLSPAMRSRVQEQFMNDEFHCLIATTAFGMGVDKPDIRYVLHLAMSSSVEAYTQESGRAGRDRKPAECMMLYSGKDIKLQQFFIEKGCPDLTVYRTIFDAFAQASGAKSPMPGTRMDLNQLQDLFEKKDHSLLDAALRKLRASDMLDVAADNSIVWRRTVPDGLLKTLDAENRAQRKANEGHLKALTRYVFEENCRTKFILDYFGSREGKSFKKCHHCDLCKAMPVKPEPGTPGAFPPDPCHHVILKILTTVGRCEKASLPVNARQAASILTGSTGEPAFSGISTFGLMEYMDPAEILVLCAVIRDAGLLAQHSMGWLTLTTAGIKTITAKSLEAFPPTLQRYMRLRFPNAAG